MNLKSSTNYKTVLILLALYFLNLTIKTASAQPRVGLETKFLPDSLESSALFGRSAKMDGNRAIIGAPRMTNGSATLSGVAFIYEFNGNEWIQTQKLVASDFNMNDEFGATVDIKGDVAVVSSRGGILETINGVVYVFNYNGVRWIEVQKIEVQESARQFGSYLALNEKTLMIGNRYQIGGGFLYIYEYDGTQWIQSQRIDTIAGISVDLFKDKAVIGTDNGNAHVIQFEGESWIVRQTLVPSDSGGISNLGFGANVSIYDNKILIGRAGDNINGQNSGSAYVFDYDGIDWSESQKLISDDNASGDNFGYSVNINDGLLVIGAPINNESRGAAYIFEYNGAGWKQKYKLVKGDDEANPPAEFTLFGSNVSIDPKKALVSASGTQNGTISGACYLYEFMAQPGNVTAADGESGSQVRISWQNRSNNADGFRIYRDGIEIGSTVLAATVFNDIDAIPGKLYKYQVTAYNNFWDESNFSFADFGWRKANGNIKGTVQTKQGAAIKEVDVSATPVDSTLGLSLRFNGVDDHVAIPPAALNNAFSISAWIKTSSSADQDILAWGHTENGHRVEFKTSGGKLTYQETDLVEGTPAVDNQQINSGRWEHVAVVVSNDTTRLYINGNAGSPVTGINQNPEVNTLTIGACQNGPDFLYPFSGNIDDLQLWNRALTAEEIRKNMFYSLKGNESGLVAYWSLNDSTRSTGTIAGDYAQKGNHHGFIEGAQWSNDAAPVEYRDVTNTDGEFTIDNLFYDESREFRVTPLKPDHLFDPEYRDVELESGGGPNVSFNDTTVFTVSGQVLFAGGTCPVEGVELLLNGDKTGIFTDSDGHFDLAINEPGKTYTIAPQYGDSVSSHSFSPAEISVRVEGDIDGLLFNDTQKHLLYGKIRGGCIEGLGTARLRVTSLKNPECLSTIITTDYIGNYRIFFPAQKYTVELVYIDYPDSTNILNYFPVETVDITWENKNQNFVYHPKPLVRIEILPSELDCDNVPIMKQNNPYSVLIDVLEAYETDTCHVASGSVKIYDDIGGDPAEPTVIELKNGRAIYKLIAGVPNILGGGEHPYQKLMQIEANVDGQKSSVDQWILVTGFRPRTQTFFSTTTPELPLMILRDPPGDQSYSFLAKGSTYTTRVSQNFDTSSLGPPNTLFVNNFGNYINLNLGPIFSIGWGTGPETTIDVGAYLKISNNQFVGDGTTSSNGNLISLSVSEEFRTSDNQSVTGENGDVFIGAAINQTFYIADFLGYDPNNCRIVKDTTLAVSNDGFKSSYIYTEDHIRNTLIPQLKELRSLTVPDSQAYFDQAISVWQQVLQQNQDRKDQSQFMQSHPDLPNPTYLKERNISFSGGTSTTYYSTIQTDTLNTITYKQIIDKDLLLGSGIVIGATSEFGLQWKWQSINDSTWDTTRTSINTVGYTLSDDDPGDYFSVDVLHDPASGTPVFNLIAGTSSCPWEPGTQPRDGVQLGINTFVQNDVPPDQPAVFTLTLGNTNESGEARPYDLRMIQLSNPDGAIIKVGGVPMGDALSYYIPAGDSAYQATLTVERGPRAYDYDNLQIMMVPPCEWDSYNSATAFADTVTFSVHFASPISNAILSYPQNNWQIDSGEPDSLAVVINDYNIRNDYLKSIKFQYRKPAGTWIDAFSVSKDQLPDESLTRYWKYQNLPDGDYELRAVSDGGNNGVRYSRMAKGRIDRNALIVRGTPEPADGVLNVGESIAISFAAGIDPGKLDIQSDISLIDAADSTRLKFSVSVQGNRLLIQPSIPFPELGERKLIATVDKITDNNGNQLSHPVSWQFQVNQQAAYWKSFISDFRVYQGSEEINNAILYNSGSESEDYQMIHVPTWLSISEDQQKGTIAAGKEKLITFRLDKNIAKGTQYDSVTIRLAGRDETRKIKLDILSAPPQWSLQTSVSGTFMTEVYAQLLFQNQISDDNLDIAGVFIDDKLRGLGRVRFDETTGQYLTAFQVYYPSTEGGTLEFRLWDASEGREYRHYSHDIVFQAGNSIGSRNKPLIIQPNEIFQSIPINQGWNWISFNVAVSDLSISRVLKDYPAQPGDVLKGQFGFSEYTKENGWTGTLDVVHLETGYRLLSKNNVELVASGRPANSWATPATLLPGWNWIGYLPEKSLALEDALYFMQSVPGDMIKSQSKSAIYNNNGEWLGTLHEMQPGQSYLLYNQAGTDLVYPDLKKKQYQEKTNWAIDAYAYETNMTTINTFSFEGKDYGDTSSIIAAFVDGQCRGVARPQYVPYLDRYVTFLMIYGDPSENGDSVQVQIYNPSSEVTRNIAQRLIFNTDAHYGSLNKPQELQALQTESERIPDEFYLQQNYPNPFNPSTTIEYGLPVDADVAITIYNVLGQKVSVLFDKRQKAGRYKIRFDAVKLKMASGIYFYRIRTSAFIKSHKMLLLK